MYLILVPAGKNRVGIFETWLMRCGNCAAARFLDQRKIKGVIFGQFEDRSGLGIEENWPVDA